ncbi:tetratricopeptide repeat protein [Criblamydia sequanensis]|uniref:Uncharacterized protein n=1 Tax=Candidatus Criblamydia sequanensis CRIB-18 TaxID=1437425 RepID=A0A090D064_9BACT|nr:tetratricopeptide repeat protein [Criblamydia sequanensis]CDR34676.1 Conserved hypothetical protein [Criblamydia sequanensis CRIB-18]
MSRINWLEKLKWNEEQIEDIQNAAYAYIKQGKYDIALPFFEALVVLEPDNPYNSQTLGALHLQLGHAKEAIRALDQALKIEADHGPTLLNLTKALFMLGKRDEGLKLAHILKNEKDLSISNVARALILAYER